MLRLSQTGNDSGLSSLKFWQKTAGRCRTGSVIDRSFVTPDVFRLYLCRVWNDARLSFTPISF
jgi:hypothetical protein